ncbi:MAG: peptidylprolyl isomerase [Desulfobulbus propionicus]|nr:MAG: peptidylprolyl isomerase [Desulfobulbus propionicus]
MRKPLGALLILLCFLSSGTALSAEEENKMKDGLYAKIATNKGEIVLNLYFDKTPLTVINFVGLSEGTLHMSGADKPLGKPYYDGLTFHRVIDNFMIQGGCPLGTGTGGPGYTFPDEIRSTLKHDSAGILSMANAGPGTNGSQFFITHLPTPHLDGKHTVFGKVVKGQDVVNSIRKDDIIQHIEILRVGKDAENFKTDQEAFDQALGEIQANAEKESEKEWERMKKTIKQKWPEARRTDSGMYYQIEKDGIGSRPAKGDTVSVHYTGRLLADYRKFDSSYQRKTPLAFPVGTGRVIPGWDEALMDMKKGEERTIILPPELAYGERGAGDGVIPPNAWLVFYVELVDIVP